MAQLISLNSACLQPHQHRIHQKTRSSPFRRPYCFSRPRRNSSSTPNKWTSPSKPPSLNLETIFLKGAYPYPNRSTELPAHTSTGSYQAYVKKNKIRSASRDATYQRQHMRQVMTSPELRLNVDTQSFVRSGNHTSYMTRKKHKQSSEDLIGLKSIVSENGKVMTLNLFDPVVRYQKTLRETNNWLLSDQQPFIPNKRRKRMVNPYTTFTSTLKPREISNITPLDFQIKPWGEDEVNYK